MRNVFDFWDQLSDEQKAGVREVEKKYGANKWWESDDPSVIIAHQLKERFMMMSFPQYKDALEKLTESPVCDLDYAFNPERVKADAERAIERKKAGVGQNDEQREAAHADHVRRIEEIVETQLPKGRVMNVDLSQRPDGNDSGIDVSGYDGWLKPE